MDIFSLDISHPDIFLPGHYVPWTFFPGHFAIGHFLPGHLVPWTFSTHTFFSLDITSSGHFPLTFRTQTKKIFWTFRLLKYRLLDISPTPTQMLSFMWGGNIYSDLCLYIINVLYVIVLLLSGLVVRIKARDQSCWTLRATISSHNKSSMHENAQIFFTKTIFTIFLRHRSFVRTCHSLKWWYFVLTTLLLYSGCVQLDGVDIRDLNLAHIRDHIGTYCMVI